MKTSNITALSLLLIVLCAFGSAQTFAAFKDVDADHSYYDAINYGAKTGIVEGYDDGTYKPDDQINRAEFVKIVIGASYDEQQVNDCLGESDVIFSDVINTAWYGKYVCMAKQAGIVGGYPDGTFRSAQNINFVEAAKIIGLSMEGQVDSIFGVNSGEDWFKGYVQYLADNSAIPATIESGEYLITRGEMMEMIFRLRGNVGDRFSLSYDQVAGQQKSCVKAGGIAYGTVSPQYQTSCCEGLISYAPSYSQGQILVGGGALCLDPVHANLKEAVELMSTKNECTENVDLSPELKAPRFNINSNKFAFSLDSKKPGCAARCDVDTENAKVTIGWMCTGGAIN